MLVCLAMFALGGAVLWGLFLAPRGRSPAAPDLPWGAPMQPLRFVSIEFGGQPGVRESLVQSVKDLDPDYVLVQNIRFDDVLPLAEALGMARSFHPQLFQRPDPRSADAPGDLILSKHALYEAGPLVLDPDPTHTHARGVKAVAATDQYRFIVATGVGATDDSLRALDDWRKQTGFRPIIVATGFVKPQKGEGTYRSDLVETVTLSQDVEQGKNIVPVTTVYADKGWVMTKGEALQQPGMLFVELKAWTPSAAAATKPWR
jgi:hypothetical protein